MDSHQTLDTTNATMSCVYIVWIKDGMRNHRIAVGGSLEVAKETAHNYFHKMKATDAEWITEWNPIDSRVLERRAGFKSPGFWVSRYTITKVDVVN